MGKEIKFGLSAPMPGADLDGVLNFSVKADKMGFDSVWYPDHVVFVSPTEAHEAWTIATAAASATATDQTPPTADKVVAPHLSSARNDRSRRGRTTIDISRLAPTTTTSGSKAHIAGG